MSSGIPGGSLGKESPAAQETQETRVQSLSREDPLEEGMATRSSILAWRIPWTEEPGGLQSDTTEVTQHAHMHHQHYEANVPALGPHRDAHTSGMYKIQMTVAHQNPHLEKRADSLEAVTPSSDLRKVLSFSQEGKVIFLLPGTNPHKKDFIKGCRLYYG